jgi:RNase P subunit RPR2
MRQPGNPSDRYERFNDDEAARIARMLVAGGGKMVCPHCSGPLVQDAVLGMTMDTVVLIRCSNCARAVTLKDLPPPGPTGAP